MKIRAVNKLSKLLKYFNYNTRDIICEISGERSFTSFSGTRHLSKFAYFSRIFSVFRLEILRMRNAISFHFRSLTHYGPDRYIRLIKFSTEHYLKNYERIYQYVNIMSYGYFYKIINVTYQKTWARAYNMFYHKITWPIHDVLKRNVIKNVRKNYFSISFHEFNKSHKSDTNRLYVIRFCDSRSF